MAAPPPARGMRGMRGAPRGGRVLYIRGGRGYFRPMTDADVVEPDETDWQLMADEAVREKQERLGLRWCHLGDEGAKYVSDNVLKNKEARVVELLPVEARISNEGLRLLSAGLKENQTVKSLHLASNEISDEGMLYLAEALVENETLIELYLNGNQIGDEGATMLAEGLKRNKSLQTLELTANLIGDEGTRCLAKGLKANQSLKTLALGRNVGNAGVEFLMAAVRVNTSLTQVDLMGNDDVSDEVKRALKEALKNKTARNVAREEYLIQKASRMVKSAAKR